jgi:ABC-type glutathione transport system ATPase component
MIRISAAPREVQPASHPPWARTTAATVVEVRNLTITYGTAQGPAVEDLSFSIERAETFGLVGESGSGKTTTALALLGLLKPPATVTAGGAYINGLDVTRASADELRSVRWKQIALIPQGAMNALNPVVKIGSQIRECFRAHGARRNTRGLKPRIVGLLEGVGLPAQVYDMYPHELSGGMKQRVCIAMATALEPDAIVADEPTSSLDVVVQRQVIESIRKAQAALGAALLFIGHDLALQSKIVDRIGVMHRGRLVEIGPTLSVFANPAHWYTQMLFAAVPPLPGRAAPLADALLRHPRPVETGSAHVKAPLQEIAPNHFAAVAT